MKFDQISGGQTKTPALMCIRTLVVMPNSYFPDTAQAGIRGDMKNVESVACECSSAVEMAVSTAALTAIQTDSHMSRCAWRDRERLITSTHSEV